MRHEFRYNEKVIDRYYDLVKEEVGEVEEKGKIHSIQFAFKNAKIIKLLAKRGSKLKNS